MPNQNQVATSQQTKRKGSQHRPSVTAKHVQSQIAGRKLPKDLAETMANSSLQDQVAYLSDARFPTGRRQAIATQIGQVAGNHYLTRVMAQMNRDSQALPMAANQGGRLPTIASLPSNRSIIARQDSETQEQTAEQPHVPFGVFGNLTTYAQLAAAARFAIGQIQASLREAPPGDPVHDRAAEFIEGLRAWLPFLEQQGETDLTPAAAAQARLWLEEGIAVQEAIVEARRAAIQREMNRVAARARTAAQRVEQLRPHLNNCLRAAYRSGDTSAISSVAGIIGSALDIGMGLHELARESAAAVASLRGVDLPAVGRYVTALDRLNRGLAAFNLAFSLTQTEATTQMEEAMRQLTVAVGAFSSLATLAGLPAHMGLYANLYLVPLTNAIMAGISRLVGLLQQENDIWVAVFGEPARYAVEPGGRPMWQFMVSVMRARSVDGIPQISSEVEEYLVEHRAALEAGLGEQAPTEGWWFWRSLNTERARRWIFNNRDLMWAMFYGNRVVPN